MGLLGRGDDDEGGDPPCWEGLIEDQRDQPQEASPLPEAPGAVEEVDP